MIEACLCITGISTEKKETSDIVLTKLNIPDSTIDCAHRIGKKGKRQAVIVCLTTHRHCTLFYKARRNIKSGPKIHIDLRNKQFYLLQEAQNFVSDDLSLCRY